MKRWFDLITVFAYRDVSIRYKQSFIGLGWALFKPLITVGIFTIVFGLFLKIDDQSEKPFALFVMAGMIPWLFFSNAMGDISSSLIADQEIIKKVAFPRLVVPVAALAPSFVELCIGILLLIFFSVFFDFTFWKLLLIFPILLWILIIPLGLGILFASLNVFYRDFRFVIPFLLQIGLYITPIGYPSSIIPEEYLWIMAINPMFGVVELFRWVFDISEKFPAATVLLPGFFTVLVFTFLGIKIFKNLEKYFADLI